MSAAQLWWAVAGMTPSGTGSYSYWSNFRIVVDNIAYSKTVGIWGRSASSGVWSFYPASYLHSTGATKEVWSASISDTIDRFVVKYDVAGTTYWDNNNGHDYFLNTAAAESTDGIGTAVIGQAIVSHDDPSLRNGQFALGISVQNLYYAKHVGVRYTTDNWATFHDALATYQQGYAPDGLPYQPQVESFYVNVPLTASEVKYAVFFDGQWDNNFGQNYGPTLMMAAAVQAKPSKGSSVPEPLLALRSWPGQALQKELKPASYERPLRAN